MLEFLNQNIRRAKGIKIPAREIYERYLLYCSKKSIHPLTIRQFNKQLTKVYGLEKSRGIGNVVVFKDVYLLKCRY